MNAERRRRFREYGLTAGTLGSTSSQTIMVSLLPLLIEPYAPSAFWIGFAVAGEGLFALMVPYWVGAASDALPTRWVERVGRRTLFLLLMAPLMAVALAVAPFLEGYIPLALAAFVFFAAFQGYLTPLWALMVDAVPKERLGRVHGARGAFHAIGVAYGLVGGALLFAWSHEAPFLIAAGLVLVTTGITIWMTPAEARRTEVEPAADPEASQDRWHEIVRRPRVGWFLLANTLWTGAIDGIRPYVFLFVGAVLGIEIAQAGGVLLLLVAGIGIGSFLLGHLGDRYGRMRLLTIGLAITGLTMAAGFFVRDLGSAVLLLLFAGIGSAALIALPFPAFTELVQDQNTGRTTGLYILSVGIARVSAPMLIGAAIDLGGLYMPATRGYPLMWPVAGALALLSIPALRRSIRHASSPPKTLQPQ